MNEGPAVRHRRPQPPIIKAIYRPSTTSLAALHKIVVAFAGIADTPETQDGLKFAAYDPSPT
jgi:hypothetical protein